MMLLLMPNSAYASLRLDSMQFNSIPTRKYRIRGIKVRIPGAGASVLVLQLLIVRNWSNNLS